MGIARFCFPYGNRTTSTKSRFPYGNQGIQGNRAIPIWESTVDALGIVAENLQNVLFTRSEGQTMLSIVKCYCFVRLSDVSQSRRFHDRDSFVTTAKRSQPWTPTWSPHRTPSIYSTFSYLFVVFNSHRQLWGFKNDSRVCREERIHQLYSWCTFPTRNPVMVLETGSRQSNEICICALFTWN